MRPVLKTSVPKRRFKGAFSRFLIVLFEIMTVTLCLAAKDFVKPEAKPAQTYPAHDDHPDEKVAIAADPYDTPEKAKLFSVNFHDHGFLPIFFVVTNDGSQPLRGYLPPPHQSPRQPEQNPAPHSAERCKGRHHPKTARPDRLRAIRRQSRRPPNPPNRIPILHRKRHPRSPRRPPHLSQRRQRRQRHRTHVLRNPHGQVPESS